MAPRGPAPKPAELRQRTNKKVGSDTLETPDRPEIPEIPNPDGRQWHPLTLQAWQHAWESPMSTKWVSTDRDALGRLALLWDQFYNRPSQNVMAEIRLQEQRFGFSPLDRSRLQWEIKRAEEKPDRQDTPKRPAVDPRRALMAVK